MIELVPRILVGTLVLLLGIWLASSEESTVQEALFPRQGRRGLQQDKYETSAITWQNLPLTHHDSIPTSSVHCVGENFNQSTAWEYRSCQFTHLCFDTAQDKFVVFRSTREAKLHALYTSSPEWQSTVTLSTLLSHAHSSVSLGTILQESARGDHHHPWFPSIIDEKEAQELYKDGYYMVPDEYVWIPWQPTEATASSRFWLWTDWWPLFVVTSLFPDSASRQLLPMVVPDTSPSSSSRIQQFERLWKLPLTIDASKTAHGLICAHRAVAGLGRLAPVLGETDSMAHGPTLHDFSNHVRTTLSVKQRVPTRLVSLVNETGLRAKWEASVPGFHDITTLDFQQQAEALNDSKGLVMTLSYKCWAPILVPDQTVVLVLHRPSEMTQFVDCVYVLNNAAFLQVEWIDMDATLTVKTVERVQRALNKVQTP